MAEFKAGDRVVKMSGTGAGKYGTVNSVMDNGTLNVTFDGERLPRYCDPMRCGQVATNARKTVEWGQDNWDGTPVNVYLEDDGTYTFWRRGEAEKRGLTKDAAMKLYQAAAHGPRYNSRAANNIPAGYERIPGKSGGALGKGTIVGYGNDAYRVLDGRDPDRIKIEKLNGGEVKYVSDLDLDYPLRKKVSANSRALNWNYRNSYQFFCVDPSMKAPCIYSGWDYREDAKDDAAELKELGIPHKIVSRRFLEQNGIDPNAEISWKKNR